MHKNLLDNIDSESIMKKLCTLAVLYAVFNDISRKAENGKGVVAPGK